MQIDCELWEIFGKSEASEKQEDGPSEPSEKQEVGIDAPVTANIKDTQQVKENTFGQWHRLQYWYCVLCTNQAAR